jgi:hypothetical protein
MPRHFGKHRENRRQFPYESRIVGGRLVMPAELQRLHQTVSGDRLLVNVTDEMRVVVKTLWPELVHKLPCA